MELDESTEVLKVIMKDINTGDESILYERPGRKQHFKEVFKFGIYYIQLRLDWTDIRKGEPTLDADIWTENKIGKKEPLEKDAWHNAERELDKETGFYVYEFDFENLKLILCPKKTMAKKFSVDAILS
jgi:hypothetical protein